MGLLLFPRSLSLLWTDLILTFIESLLKIDPLSSVFLLNVSSFTHVNLLPNPVSLETKYEQSKPLNREVQCSQRNGIRRRKRSSFCVWRHNFLCRSLRCCEHTVRSLRGKHHFYGQNVSASLSNTCQILEKRINTVDRVKTPACLDITFNGVMRVFDGQTFDLNLASSDVENPRWKA